MSKFLDQQGLQVLWDLIKNGFQPIRRQDESEYDPSFIPKQGEICLVNTPRDGLRIKIGDGETTFANLDFLDIQNNIILRGFYFENKFYYNSAHTQLIPAAPNKLYIDLPSGLLYYYDAEQYKTLNKLPEATEEVAGITKLYSEVGQNVDGAMSQKAITDELNTKFKVEITSGVLKFTH